MFLSAVVLLLSLSTTLYVNLYFPSFVVSTLPLIWIFDVKSPSSLSLALTPALGSKLSPTFIVLSLTPFITGFSLLSPFSPKRVNVTSLPLLLGI